MALLEEPQEDGGAVLGAELINGFIKNRRNLGKVGLRVIGQRSHFHGLSFAITAAAFVAHGFGGDKAGMTMQPPTEHDLAGKVAGLAGQVHKDGLSHVLRQVCVAIYQPNGGRIDQLHITRDQFAKSGFRTGNVSGQQLLAIGHRVFITKDPPGYETGQKI